MFKIWKIESKNFDAFMQDFKVENEIGKNLAKLIVNI